MTHDPTHDAEMDAIVAELEKTGLVETYVDQDGQEAMRLTAKGAAMGRALAMAGEDVDPDAVLEQLLGQG